MRRARNLAGQTFGRLTVQAIERSAHAGVYWRCTCQCGQSTVVLSGNLTRGHTQSCGCYRDECSRNRSTIIHGHASQKTPTYYSWLAMNQRCNNRNHKHYNRYGGRGIIICPQWRDYDVFLAYMGERPKGCTLDRENGNGNYEPDNCRWATPQQQADNKS